MAWNNNKYKELSTFEEYPTSPFTITQITTFIMKPSEHLLRPLYREDGMPKKVEDDGRMVTLGTKFYGQEHTMDKRPYTKLFVEFLPVLINEKYGLPAVRVLFYILFHLKPKSQSININMKAARNALGYKTNKAVMEGLVDLLRLGVLARKEETEFWINPQAIFRGRRDVILNENETN